MTTERIEHDPVEWFREHFDDAAGTVVSFLGGDGIDLAGKQVADIGCGDGVIDLGVALKGSPERLVGYDIRPTDTKALVRAAQAAGVATELPACLSFETSGPEYIPAPDDTFDVVYTWSAFEHVSNPVALLRDIRRVLKEDGCLFLQLWPFYHSEHGGHLWIQYEDPFPHLTRDDATILDEVRGERATDPSRSAGDEYRSLNRLTLDELQRALLATGLLVTKLHLLTATVHIPPRLAHVPLTQLGVGGVELLAVPR
jgi:SAM-dependent methyltransferase